MKRSESTRKTRHLINGEYVDMVESPEFASEIAAVVSTYSNLKKPLFEEACAKCEKIWAEYREQIEPLNNAEREIANAIMKRYGKSRWVPAPRP